MGTNDIECMGAIYSLITDHFDRIQPALEFDEYHPFVLTYFRRCLLEDPRSEWADTRYGAGHNIVGWFVWAWRTPTQRTSTVAELKEWLAALYLTGDSELRTCLVQATLEHLFENREVTRELFDLKYSLIRIMPRPPKDPEALLPLKQSNYRVLLALTDGEWLHGYAIMQAVAADDRRAGRRSSPAPCMPRSARMVDEGLVEGREAPDDDHSGGPARRYYRRTSFGRAVARAESERLRALLDIAVAQKIIGHKK